MSEKAEVKEFPAAQLTSLALFILSSIFAVYLADIALQVEPSISASSPTSGFGYVVYYLVAAIVFSVLLIVLARKYRMNFLKWLFVAVIGLMVFYTWSYLGFVIARNAAEYYVIIFAAPAIMILALIFNNKWYVVNIAGFFLTSGMAFVLGLILGIWAAAVFLAAFAIYDYISVYKTKHMIGLAKIAIDRDLPMLFVFPTDFSKQVGKIEITEDGIPGHTAMALGFGDIAFPGIMVVASAIYGLKIGHFYPFLILPLVGGVVGMLYLVLGKVKKPAPGLPFLNTGVIAGTLLSYLLFVVVH
ncbi:MAG: presenilin family intramembrane aspartyl protease [Thermoplasmatales archaeon]|nr:presenilin family intramembrane aspartyl protease [Candidatus Thermoplasmatota archaeon]MCL6003166.1 presenilin family intramembrane aspartyl protease [Candidatus Thermoplasmatota archaeon]MDA8055803.1 presenilin family intramembrane aspartyl protease [Thermoplasmatales archaeon]